LTTVLVVDNNRRFMAYLSVTLTKHGYTAVPTSNAARAMLLLKELNVPHVDVLVVNFDVPGSLELAKALGSKIIAIERGSEGVTIAATLQRPQRVSTKIEQEWLRVFANVLDEA
jgi:PleD family two-component response regulator